MTTKRLRGMLRLTFLRLCSRAPWMPMACSSENGLRSRITHFYTRKCRETRLIFPGRNNFFGRGLVENLVLDHRALRELLAGKGFLDRVEGHRPQERIALNRAVELSGNHRVKGVFDPVH